MINLLNKHFPGFTVEYIDDDVYALTAPDGSHDITVCTDEVYTISAVGELRRAYTDITVSEGDNFARFRNTEDMIAYINELISAKN